MSMQFHPFSEVFPMLPDSELQELADDIKTFGLREPIWLYEGRILDGRNRWIACQKAKVNPQTRTFKGTERGALALVISNNLRRRQLTDVERAFAADELAKLANGQRKSASPAGEAGLTQQEAADALKVSKRSVERVRKVKEKGSAKLIEATKSGEVPLSRAAAVVDLPKREQLAAARAPAEKATEADPDCIIPDPTEEERLAAFEREHAASLEKLLAADDKLAAAYAEIKRQAAEIASLKLARDGFQNKSAALIKQVKALQRENERLKRKAA